MIQANELRIENIVIYKGKIRKIFSLSKDWLRIEDERHSAISYQNLIPVKLSEEILLNCGFEKVVEELDGYTNVVYELVIDTFTKIIIQSDFSFGLESKNNSDESLSFTNDILKSVHRLQNLYFALKGEELTIKL